jgi:hypothetical protein
MVTRGGREMRAENRFHLKRGLGVSFHSLKPAIAKEAGSIVIDPAP